MEEELSFLYSLLYCLFNLMGVLFNLMGVLLVIGFSKYSNKIWYLV